MKQGIIFDMDGTLWDSTEKITESWNLAIKESGMLKKTLSLEDVQSVMGKTMNTIADILFTELEEKERYELLEKCCVKENEYLRENGGILYPEVEKTLAVLKEKYPLYIVSNCQAGYIEAFLDHYGFGKYFEDIECFGNNQLQKADNIKLIVARNHMDKAVYIGDIQGDYDASCRAGVGFIHAAYGFGIIAAEVQKVDCFAELPEAVDNYFV